MAAIATTQAANNSTANSVIVRLANRFGVDANKLLSTLKATAFKATNEVSNEQMMMLLIVADQYHLNPLTREIYAFPDKGGIVPVVGVDGWSRIINEHPQFDGIEYVFADDGSACTCVIYRKDRSHSISVTEYMAECKRGTQPWSSHPRRMLRHKATIQCARMAFGFAGIYDPDEAERIREAGGGEDAPAPASLSRVRAALARPAATTVDMETGELDSLAASAPLDLAAGLARIAAFATVGDAMLFDDELAAMPESDVKAQLAAASVKRFHELSGAAE